MTHQIFEYCPPSVNISVIASRKALLSPLPSPHPPLVLDFPVRSAYKVEYLGTRRGGGLALVSPFA